MSFRRIFLPPILLFLGFLIIAGLFSRGVLPDPIIHLRVDLSALAVLVGLALSVILATGLALRKRTERVQQKIRSQAASDRRRFLHRLDHELKNPLTAIRVGLANLAETHTVEARRKTLDNVESQTVRLSRLAADLRKLAELETRPLEGTSVDVADLLQEALTLAEEQPEAEDRHLTLIPLPQAPWPLPSVSGDQDLLFLAVYNLLSNALKFSQPGDAIEVRAFEDGTTVVIEVADTGPGIPEAEIPHIWEELYRGQEMRGVPGSGLGLTLARAIINRHDGQISLRSRSGQGTVVTVRLPVE